MAKVVYVPEVNHNLLKKTCWYLGCHRKKAYFDCSIQQCIFPRMPARHANVVSQLPADEGEKKILTVASGRKTHWCSTHFPHVLSTRISLTFLDIWLCQMPYFSFIMARNSSNLKHNYELVAMWTWGQRPTSWTLGHGFFFFFNTVFLLCRFLW